MKHKAPKLTFFKEGEKKEHFTNWVLADKWRISYTAIEMVYSRNNPYEHRLTILRMNAKRYVPEIDRCFLMGTEEERYLFYHLDAAYIGGRYIDEEHYKVTKEQLHYWEKEAQKLLDIIPIVYLNALKVLLNIYNG